jgi:hypothetical protein
MVLKKWPALALLGAGLSLAVPLTLAPALAQTAPTRSLVITSPAAGATVPSPFTVSISLVSSSGGSPAMGGNHHHGEAILVVDAPTPSPGDIITPDADHLVFPPGQTELTVSLPAGTHHLQIVAATHKGKVTYKVQPSAPLTVTVQ